MATRLALHLSIALVMFSGCSSDEPRPYGGEVLVSHVQLPDGGNLVRLSAHFIAAQDPDLAPADVPLGECGPDHSFDQTDRRQYIDVGENVTFHLGFGDIVVPRLGPDPDNRSCEPGVPCDEGVMDFSGRMHELAYVSEMAPAELGDDFLMGRDSLTTAVPQSFAGEISVLQPPLMQLDSPILVGGQALFRRGEDVEFTWQQGESVDDLTVKIVFSPSEATIPTSCRVLDTGSFTVPASVIDGLESATGSVIVYSISRATVTTEEGRAIDVRAEYHGHLFPFQRESSSPGF